MSDNVLLSVVVPIRNEEAILWDNMKTVAACFDEEVGPGRWQFILVDNGSTDATPEIILRVLERWPPSRSVFVAEPNYGKALRAGVEAADSEWIHFIDVEQWDLPFFKWCWRYRERYDLFIASKRADPSLCRQPRYRRFLSWGLNALLQLFFLYPGSETHGPKLLNRKNLAPILEQCVLDRGQYDTEIALRSVQASKWIVELPVPFAEVRPTRALMFKKIYFNVRAFNRLRRVFQERSRNPGPVRMHRLCREDVLANVAPPARAPISEPENAPPAAAAPTQKEDMPS